MPSFSLASRTALLTCDTRLQAVMAEAIRYYDFKVEEGHRSVARQQALYAQGRTTPGQIVTNVDGVRVKGMHNWTPSRAVDITPWPLRWNAPITEFYRMAGVILAVSGRLGIRLNWGGEWSKLKDFPHFEIVEQ